MAKIGRPKKDEPKDEQYRLRMTKAELDKLALCAEKAGLTKAEVLLKGIDLVYDQITKK